jgi:deoxyhypusine synthase
MKRKQLLQRAVKPIAVREGATAGSVVQAMGDTGFQARNLARAAEIWGAMLRGRSTILMGVAGAMVPAGMRGVLAHVIKHRLIDCLVATGANLFHDLHETLGNAHYQGSEHVDDTRLAGLGIDRIHDVFASEAAFRKTDRFIARFAARLDQRQPYSTREFFFKLGESLRTEKKHEGIITAAHGAGVPIYCPALGDSSYGIALAYGRAKGTNSLVIDPIVDVLETAEIVARAGATGVIYIAGGTPKNFIQQTEVTYSIMSGKASEGHRYAIQVTTDAPHWGGLSGCTFEEAQSWGKIARRAKKVTVFCDATIALPLLVHAVSERYTSVIRKRRGPDLIARLAR